MRRRRAGRTRLDLQKLTASNRAVPFPFLSRGYEGLLAERTDRNHLNGGEPAVSHRTSRRLLKGLPYTLAHSRMGKNRLRVVPCSVDTVAALSGDDRTCSTMRTSKRRRQCNDSTLYNNQMAHIKDDQYKRSSFHSPLPRILQRSPSSSFSPSSRTSPYSPLAAGLSSNHRAKTNPKKGPMQRMYFFFLHAPCYNQHIYTKARRERNCG